MDLTFPGPYPVTPPDVVMVTKILHPNVGATGRIRFGCIIEHWEPSYGILVRARHRVVVFEGPVPAQRVQPRLQQSPGHYQ